MNSITTSRKPSIRTRTFAKNVAFLFGATYLVRGKGSISNLISNCRYEGTQFLFIVTERHGNPFQILMLQVTEKNWELKETFFVKVLVAHNEFDNAKADGNLRFREFVLASKNKALNWIIKTVGADITDDSDVVVKDFKGAITTYYKDVEVGPRFELCNNEVPPVEK